MGGTGFMEVCASCARTLDEVSEYVHKGLSISPAYNDLKTYTSNTVVIPKNSKELLSVLKELLNSNCRKLFITDDSVLRCKSRSYMFPKLSAYICSS